MHRYVFICNKYGVKNLSGNYLPPYHAKLFLMPSQIYYNVRFLFYLTKFNICDNPEISALFLPTYVLSTPSTNSGHSPVTKLVNVKRKNQINM